jgi:hypothetical protein
MAQLLKLISINNITLLKDLDTHVYINKDGKFYYKDIPSLQLMSIINFINKLEDDQIYTIIPLVSTFGTNNDPHIVINKQILITKYSSPQLIHNFL